MREHVCLQKLLSWAGSPYDVPLWRGLRDPIDPAEVERAIEQGRLNSPSDNGPSDSTAHDRTWHIERIAWFVVHGWTEPIEISSTCMWPVVDGNHRLSAAIYRSDELVEVQWV